MLKIGLYISLILLIIGCRKDPIPQYPGDPVYEFTPPEGFSYPYIPSDNQFTFYGVELGKKLFYDELLSGDNTMACASCHFPQNAFSDTTAFSTGIDGLDGPRNSMPLFNLAWVGSGFFWDGRAATLEEQVLMPVQDPIEMHESWTNAISEISSISEYQDMFDKAFGTPGVDSVRAAKALAQFLRTLVSGNSPFDQFLNSNKDPSVLGSDWQDIVEGYELFKDNNKGDCIHCHTDPAADRNVTDYSFRNNGLDMVPADPGAGNGTFKVPSLRNLSYTAPYMHDGRFNSLDEVLDHYVYNVQASPHLDPSLYQVDSSTTSAPGVQLSPIEVLKVKKFLLSLNDPSFLTNPDYQP